MDTTRTQTLARRAITTLMTVTLMAACGGDDGAEPDQTSATATAEPSDALAENEARDDLLGAVDDDTDVDLDDAIASLSPATRYDIAAGQLDPEPTVEIDGDSIRLVFGDGTVTNAVMDCILAGAVQRADETLTLVYPDGDQVC